MAEKERQIVLTAISDSKAVWPGWETVRLIGRGSFGAVYEIEQTLPNGEKDKAALKVISIPQSDSEIEELYGDGYDTKSITDTYHQYMESVVSEYTLIRKMNGTANVVNCDEAKCIQHDNNIGWDVCIKMELLTSLPKALSGHPTEAQTLRIAKDMCRALILCRKYGIVHRDIKPANIFYSENGDYKLGDFGIAKTMEKTSGGTKIGTYEYMAPEVYHDEPYGSTADIYSLGLVMYWLLNERRTPFLRMPPSAPTSSEKEQARKRRFGGEALPAPAHGSGELKRIVLKACAYDPEDRYQSAAEMLQELEALGIGAAPIPEYEPVKTEEAPQSELPEPVEELKENPPTEGAFQQNQYADMPDGNAEPDEGGTLGFFHSGLNRLDRFQQRNAGNGRPDRQGQHGRPRLYGQLEHS